VGRSKAPGRCVGEDGCSFGGSIGRINVWWEMGGDAPSVGQNGKNLKILVSIPARGLRMGRLAVGDWKPRNSGLADKCRPQARVEVVARAKRHHSHPPPCRSSRHCTIWISEVGHERHRQRDSEVGVHLWLATVRISVYSRSTKASHAARVFDGTTVIRIFSSISVLVTHRLKFH